MDSSQFSVCRSVLLGVDGTEVGRGEDVKVGGWEECEVRDEGDDVMWLFVPEAVERNERPTYM